MNKIILSSGFELPQLAYGPDSIGSIRGYKYNRSTIFHRVKNKFVSVCIDEPYYIKSITSSIKVGFDLIDYSASYGDGSLIAKVIKNLIKTGKI